MTRLEAAYARLNDKQREAVDCDEDTVVLAGPGSGKTDTLVLKAACVLASEVRPPQGVACITYTRAAAREVANRVRALGVRPGRQLFAGTLHGFCLRMILSPFADLVAEPHLREPEVATAGTRQLLLQDAMDREGLNQRAQYWGTTLQVIRRAIASNEDPEAHFDRWQLATVARYETNLMEAGLVDYDGMVHHALRFVETYPRVVDVLASSFPWILVDEYQDLGGPLHRLVCGLRERGGMKVFAVGDPDQTIMQFTGADARYLRELENLGFHPVRLRLNYRSGGRLIAAAAAALGHDHGYEPAPEVEYEGEAQSKEVTGGVLAHAEYLVTDLIPRLEAEDIPLHEIAILYPQKSNAVDELRAALDEAEIPHSFERDERFPSHEPIVEWLQRCAQYALGAGAPSPVRFRDLADELRGYLTDAGRPEARSDLATAVLLYPAVDAAPSREDLLLDWLSGVIEHLDLRRALEDAAIYKAEADALDSMLARLRGSDAGTTVGSFAGPLRQLDHLVVTTYHSSKGRQFDAVILPFLQEAFMPRYRRNWRTGQWSPDNVNTDRLLFYVAFTRARRLVTMVWSPSSMIDPRGQSASFPPSRFVGQVEAVL